MNYKNKIYAFTIMEIIVTMIVSSLIITFIIGMYLTNQQNLNNYIKISDMFNNNLTFLSIIKTDIEKAKYIYKTNTGIELISTNKKIQYDFSKKMVIKNTTISYSDTFNVQISDYNLIKIKENSSLIKSIDLFLTIDGFNIEILLNKEYSNSILFKIDGD